MKSFFPIALLITALGCGFLIVVRMGKSSSRYERKSKSTWNLLSDGEDPTS